MSRLRAYTVRYALPQWPFYLSGLVALAAVNLATLEIPQLAKRIINALGKEGVETATALAPADLADARQTALLIVGLGALLIVIRSLSRILIFWPGRRLEARTKTDLFSRILRLPEAFFLKHGLGDLISRLGNDVAQLRVFYAFGLLQILNLAFLLVFTISKMASVHATLTLLCLLPLVAMLGITKYAIPRMHHYSRENQDAIGDLTTKVTEAFVNVHVIQANAAAPTFTARADAENERVYATNVKLIAIRTVIFPLMTCLAGLSQLVVLFYGGREAIAGRLSVGDIMAFNVYIGLLSFPLTALGIILAVYQRAKTALDRIGEIEDAQVETARPVVTAGDREPVTTAEAPLLEVRGLSFRFAALPTATEAAKAAAGDAPLSPFSLEGIDLTVRPGQRIGLFGGIGSGKSTLFNLLTRLYEPPEATVFWRGRDVTTLEPRELRREVGYALQSVHLFSDTIRNNLAFGVLPPPPEEELQLAAAGAQILPEIEAFEHGWETEIGEKGVRLSGGQKQRLALARLFLRRPALLLLDDVLSAVDHKTERRLIEFIYGLGGAMIIASHRGAALRHCDEILILGDGRLRDRGKFAELAVRHPELARDL
jgi:ATP-binding cassette subfamily B protein